MNIEARLEGGPADTQIVSIDGIKPEIVIHHQKPEPVRWWEPGSIDKFELVPYERHTYVPVRAVVFYKHADSVTKP